MHLFAAYLGGELGPGRVGEDHGRAHVDALTRLDMVDGYGIGLTRCGDGDAVETVGYHE